ncbi:hypothetical protein [Myroides profundi]|uniref:Uncharacterized protein n=1 Tax=Myroides profundi TaxID=480520 RepID=A0AAJ5BDC6_MYRPR|nr:hypothetical protein [Myroides profundi]AJH16471.1 hypothetical protein MPR_3352 [Myroides profundi]SEQ53761.1 hypothetical protein SAMN04488089_1043 [Myroides profundi]
MNHAQNALSIILLMISSICFAQDSPSVLNGKIVTRDGIFEGIVILNTSKEISVLSDNKGYFSIRSHVNDTIRFISPNHTEYQYVVNEFDIKRSPVLFPLEPLYSINRLDEIVITKIDSDALGFTDKYTRRYTPAERKLRTAKTGGGMIPVDPFINMLSGRMSMLKKNLAYEKTDHRVEKLLETITNERLVDYYQIPVDYVEGFAYYAVTKEGIKDLLNATIVDLKELERDLTPVVFEFLEMIKNKKGEEI